MDTIEEEFPKDIDAKKRAKEIEVIEIEWENEIYSENDRIVRKYFQVHLLTLTYYIVRIRYLILQQFCSNIDFT